MVQQPGPERPAETRKVHRATFDPTGRLTTIPTRALFDSRLKDHHLATLCVLAYLDSQHRDGWFEVSQAEIARFRGKSRTTVTGAVSDLVEWGYVDREERRDPVSNLKIANIYRIRFDADIDAAYLRGEGDAGTGQADDPASNASAVATGYVGHADAPKSGMSAIPTYHRRYVGPTDIPSGAAEEYVGVADIPKSSMSATPTHHIRYVGHADDNLKSLKESEDLKSAPDFRGSDSGARDLPLFGQAASRTAPAVDRLVDIFEELHGRYFGLTRRPSRDRLVQEAAAYAADGIPDGLALQIIETVFGRLHVQGDRHVSSFTVADKTWRYIVARWRDAGRPLEPQAWEDLFDENRFAWKEFQQAYPRPEGLQADATRTAFDMAAREAGTASALVEAARTYARRTSGREERWLKTAERWLRDGHWREYVAQDVPDNHGIDRPVLANSRPVDTGTVDGVATAWWPAVMAGLSNRHGQALVEMWFKDLHVRGDLQDGVVITAPTRFLRDQIDHRFGPDLQSLIAQAAGARLRLSIVAGASTSSAKAS